MPNYTIRIKDGLGTRIYYYYFTGTKSEAIQLADQRAIWHTSVLWPGETLEAMVIDRAEEAAGHSGLIWTCQYCDPVTARIMSTTTPEGRWQPMPPGTI